MKNRVLGVALQFIGALFVLVFIYQKDGNVKLHFGY